MVVGLRESGLVRLAYGLVSRCMTAENETLLADDTGALH